MSMLGHAIEVQFSSAASTAECKASIVVLMIPHRKHEGCTVDALAYESDEGRDTPAKCSGEAVSSL